MKLRLAGYWADFINPFSGRPYLTTFHSAALYETDERLHCFDFQIKDYGDCKIITSACDKCHSFAGKCDR
jgi:hypothetical protein